MTALRANEVSVVPAIRRHTQVAMLSATLERGLRPETNYGVLEDTGAYVAIPVVFRHKSSVQVRCTSKVAASLVDIIQIRV